MPLLSTIFVGGGPGGLGPLIWAAQQGSLPGWLEQGIAVVDRQDHLGGTLGRFGIHSDSLGGSYLEFLEAHRLPPALLDLREDPLTREMAAYRDSFPPLSLVDQFMRRIGVAVASMLTGPSSLHLGTTVRSVRLEQDGTVTAETTGPRGELLFLRARSAVLALGGKQLWPQLALFPGLSTMSAGRRQVMPSDQLLTTSGLQAANDILAAAGGKKIMILGGSHSAYAAAGALLGLPAAEHLAEGQICILQRREPRIFYSDRATASDDLYIVDPGDICPRTHRVNRMGGLRGHGREMWRRVTSRPGVVPEPRVVREALQDFSTEGLRTAVSSAALIVPCFGYRSATVPVFDATGARVRLNADTGGAAVADDCRLLTTDGSRLSNLFGIGLGTGYRLPPSMGGEPNFDGQANSLWLYQNDIGAAIYRAIDDLTGNLAAKTLPDVVRKRNRPQRAGVAVLASPNPGL